MIKDISSKDKSSNIDDSLQSRLASILTSQQDEYSITKRVANYIKDVTESAGCKIFIVEACSNNGVKIVRLHSTVNSSPYERPLYPVMEEKGLAEWVIYNKSPLVINNTCSVGKEETCISEDNKEFIRYAIPEDDNAQISNDEKALVIFPIIDNEKNVIGVFAIWRKNERTFSSETIDVVKSLSELIFILCNQIRQLRLERKEKEFYTQITQKLTCNTRISDAYQIILQEISELSGANHAMLVEQDKKRDHITFSIATHSTNEEQHEEEAELLRTTYKDLFTIKPFSRSLWDETCSRIMSLNPFENMDLSNWYIESNSPYFASDEDIYANWGVFLFIKDIPDYSTQIKADKKLKNSIIKRVFGFSHRIFSYYLESFIREQIRLLGKNSPVEESNLNRLLNVTSKQLLEATQAEAVITYVGDFRPRIIDVLPEKYKAHFNESQTEENSYSQQIIESAEQDFLFDVTASWPNKPRLQERQLRQLKEQLHWQKITSWQLSCIGNQLNGKKSSDSKKTTIINAVVHGAFKLLTERKHLSNADFRVLNGITQRTYQRFHQQHRGTALKELNSLSNNLATYQGSKQAKGIVKKLATSWLKDWIRPGCDVAIVAFNEKGAQISHAISENFKTSEEQFLLLAKHFTAGHKTPQFLEIRDHSLVIIDHPHKINRWGGIVISMTNNPLMELNGFLVVLSKKTFYKYQISLLQDAAKELAVLLHQEKKRHDWSSDAARFRHAIKSPANSIAINADAIFNKISFLDYPDLSESIAQYLKTIKKSSKRIENWSDWQRIETGDIQLKISRRELKPLLVEWIELQEKFAKRKNINIECFLPVGSVEIPFDRDALEIAFSNLLDNAIKYAPDLSDITVSYSSSKDNIIITITNVGEPIPSRLHKTLFDEGIRGGNMDGRRATPGQGMGLALSKSLVESHEGARLEFTQKPIFGATDKNNQFSISFRIILKHFWRGAKRK